MSTATAASEIALPPHPRDELKSLALEADQFYASDDWKNADAPTRQKYLDRSAEVFDEAFKSAESSLDEAEADSFYNSTTAFLQGKMAEHNKRVTGADAVGVLGQSFGVAQGMAQQTIGSGVMRAGGTKESPAVEVQPLDWSDEVKRRDEAMKQIPELRKSRDEPAEIESLYSKMGRPTKVLADRARSLVEEKRKLYLEKKAAFEKATGLSPSRTDDLLAEHDMLDGLKAGQAFKGPYSGEVYVSPDLALMQDEYDKAVDATDATPEKKAKAKAHRLKVRDQLAGKIEFSLAAVDPEWEKWSAGMAGEMKDASVGEKVERFIKWRKASGAKMSAIDRAVDQNAASFVKQFFGLIGGITNIGMMKEAAATAGEIEQANATVRAAIGGAGATGFAVDLFGGLAPTIAFSPLARLATTNLGAMRLMAGIGAAQGYGGKYADASAAYSEQGLSDRDAHMKAQLPALVSALTTYALARMMPRGVESIGQINSAKAAAKTAYRKWAGELLADVKDEALEEAFQAVSDEITAKFTYDPKKDMRTALENIFMSGLMGGIGGGVVGAVSRYANKVKPILETAEQMRKDGYPLAAAETEKTAEIEATKQYWADVAKAQKRAVERAQSDAGLVSAEGAKDAKSDLYNAFGNVQRKVGEPKNEKAQSVPSVQKADESVRLPQAEVAPAAPSPEPVTPAAAKPVEPIPASQSPRTTPKPKSASPQTAGKVEAPSSQNPFSASIAKNAIRKDGGSWVVKDFDGLPDFVDAPKDAPLIPDGDLPQGTEYVIVDKRFNGNPRPSYAFTPGGLVYSYESGFSGISPWRLAGAIEGESSAPTVAKDAAVAPAPAQPAAAPAAEQPAPAPIEQAIADANWRGTVREAPAPRSMGGEGVKLYIPVDASGKDVSVGGQTILGKTPAEAIELAQKNAKPAPAPVTEPTKGRAETVETLADSHGADWIYKNGNITKPGFNAKWTPEEKSAMEQRFKAAGFRIGRMNNSTGETLKNSFKIDSESKAKLDTVLDQREMAAKQAKKDADAQKKKDADAATLAATDQSALAWLNKTFGEQFANAFNKASLADFISGKESKFKGLPQPQWERGLRAIGALDGNTINYAKIKESYEQNNQAAANRPAKGAGQEVVQDEKAPQASKAGASSNVTPQSEGGIFGYAWADIRSKQQGGKLAALIRGAAVKPKATEADLKLLESKGAEWLYENGKHGIIDRLGLPVDKPSKKAVVKPTAIPKIIDVTETPGAQVSGPRLAIKLDDGTIIHSADAGIHAVLAARAGIDPSRIVDTGFYGVLSGEFKGGKTTTAPTKSTLAPAPVSEAAKLRAKLVEGATVEVTLRRGSGAVHPAKLTNVDTERGVATVEFKKSKSKKHGPFKGGETQDVRLDQVAPLKSVRTRMLNEAQFEGMTEDQKRQTKADAKEFDNLVADHPEMNWYNWRVNDLAGTKSGDMDIAAERKRASEEAMKEIGGDRPGLNPDNSIMKAELLPKLKAMIEEKAHELAREIPEDSLPDDTDFLPPGETPEPVAPKLRPSDGKGTGELLQGDAAPFNLVAETAADIAKREAREAAEQIAKDAKDAAEAKAKQDKEQGNLFDDDPFTIADTAPATSLPVESVQRAVRVVAGRLAGAMPHEVIADGSQYPQRVKDAFRKKYGTSGDLNRIRGVVVGGRIYINAAAIENAREAIETFMHEAAGHGGVDALLKAFGGKATTQLDAMLKRLFPDDYAAVQRSYEPHEQVSETLARIMQRVGPEMSAQARTRWQRVMDWLRNALNDLGVKRWSTNDVMALLRRGVDAVRKSSAATPDAGAVRMSYAGEKAQVPQFMRDSLDTAKAMAAAGKTSEEIRAVTGWFPGKYDGKMRWEVPDEAVALNEKPELANLRKEVAESTSRFEEVKAKRQGFSPAFNEAQVRMTNAQDKLRRAAGSGDMATLGERLVHPELFALYPAAKNIRLVVEPMQPNYGGYFDPISNKIAINSVHSKEAQLSSLLHEIQHWTQKQENFAEGGDLSQFLYSDDFKLSSEDQNTVDNIDAQIADLRKEERELGEFFRNLPDSMKGVGKAEKESRRLNAISYEVRALNDRRYAITKPARDKMAMDKYRRTAGEIESRDVQARQNFTPEQRKAVQPYSSENIAKKDSIVMSGGGPVQMSTAPARITPEQDREYLAAVKRGDMEAAQRMVDEAAKAAGYPPQLFFHGTQRKFNVFNAAANTRNDFGRYGKGFYFTKDKYTAAIYAGRDPFSGKREVDIPKGATIHSVYLDIKRPKTIEAKDIEMPKTAAEAEATTQKLMEEGYDGVIGVVAGKVQSPNTEYVVFSPSQIKSADPITRDADGRTIPLSERFNPESSDIRFSLKDENPEATSTARDSTNAARVARGEEPLEVITKPAIDALKEGALAELARNPDAGRELVREIIGATGQPDITPEKEALLAMHRRTLQNEIEMQSDRAMDETLTPEQREIANERWDDLEQEITELEDATNRTGSAWSNWGRIRMQETLRDFSFAMLTKRARKIKGGEQLTRDERAELKAQADKIAALHERELARRTELANIEREEAAAAAFQQGKAEAEREAEENQPDPRVTARSQQFINNLRSKVAPAVRRVKGIFDKGIGSKAGGESDVKMSLAPDPEKPAWFNDVALAGSAQMAEKNLSKEKWLASLKVLTGDTEGNLDPYADELWTASNAILDAEIAADPEESKRVKATKMKRNASKEQLIEGMAERVAEDGDTSNLGRYLKKLAVKLIESGADTREALVDAMHDSVKDIDPSLTREAVMDLWSDYGKFRPATTDEVKVKAAQLRGEVQQVRKLMDMEKGLAAKLTGIGRVEPSAEHRKLTKQVEDAKRRGGFTVTDPARQLKTALDAIQARLKNEIADMDYAIATRKPMAEHKNAITYDAQTKALKAQRDAKKAEYEKLFPKDTAAADLAAISRALDRSIAELSEQIKSGDLYPGKQGRRLTSSEIEAKRARIEALRDERTVLRGLDTARVEAAKMAATQARVDELNRQRAAGWPDSPTGTPTVDTPLLAALKAKRDELLKERQASQRPPTDPEMREIEALDKLIAEKQAKIAAGDTSSKPKSQNVKTAQVTAREAELRRLTVELAKLRNSDIARQLEQLKSRKSRQLADLLEKIAKKDFEPKAKPPEKPTDPELQSIEFQVFQAKGELMEGMADLARSRRTGLEKARDTTADVFHTTRALMTGGEFSGVFRQGKLAALSHPVITFGQAVPAMFRAFGLGSGALTATAKAAGELVQGNVSGALKTLKEHGESKEHAEMNKIWARPNAAAYKRSGLALHNPWDFTAAQLEGNYRSRWANKIPFIAGSGRAYTLFLNNLRAGLYDTLSASLSSTEGVLTAGQEKEIANLINKMTGSGNLGARGQKASEYLNVFFFAPKFVASRFQMITGAVKVAGDVATGFQISKENNAVRKLVAKEYGRMLTGIAVMYALYAAFRGDDEPIETDPRSTKFGKIPMGNGSYIDPMAGLLQVTVFLNTLRTGEVKNKKGEIKSVWMDDDGTSAFGQGDGAFFMHFLRSKMSPVAGTLYDRFVTHKMVDGKPFTYTDAVLNFVTPMTYKDIYEAMRAQGVPKGTILSTLTMFGEGLSTYENDSKPTHARSHRR